MPYLVYWFDKSLETGVPFVTLEPTSSIISYEFGEKMNYDQVPKDIGKKLARKQELTRSEQVLCNALVAMDAARESQTLSWQVPPDDVLYQIVRADKKGMSTPTPVLSRQKQNLAADVLMSMLGPPQTPSTESLSPERPLEPQPEMPHVGDRVKVWWETMDTYFYGFVDEIRGDDFFLVIYDDKELQWLPLADHNFEIVPEDEYVKETPLARELDPRFHCLSPRLSRNDGNHKSSPSVQKSGASYANKSHSRKSSNRVFVNGLWIVKEAPRKDAKGHYKRPCGRSPSGFEWE